MNCVVYSKEPMVLINNMDSYFNQTPPDCSLFSQDNHEIPIHKELLYQTKFTQEMIKSVGIDLKIEVICPFLSKEELETMVDFLYSGKIRFSNQEDISQACMNLEEHFGFRLMQDEMSETKEPLIRPVTAKKTIKQSVNSHLIGVGFPKTKIKVEKDLDYNQEVAYDEFKYDPLDNSMKEEYLMDQGRPWMDQESYYNPLDFTDKKFGCTICDHSCGSKSGMRKHIQRKHPEQNIDSRNGYQDKITKLMERSYQNREYSSANFIDDEKPNSFGANNYSNQIQNEGVGGKVKGTKKCPDCEQVFASMFLRMKHVKTMHPERKIYYCPVCKAKHLYSKSLTEHILKKHPEQIQQNEDGKLLIPDQESKSSRTMCPICKKSFNSIAGMMNHYTSEHPEGKVYDCSACDKKYLTLEGLSSHMLTGHERKVNNSTCSFCGKEFNDKKEVKTHIAEEHKEKKFQCSMCEASYRKQSTLHRHIESIHEGKRYQCTQCGEDFETMFRLETHTIVKHDRSRLLKCPTCGKLLASKKCLDKHIAFSHENTSGSLCPECGDNFRSKAQLQDHIHVVHEGKKYSCQFCAATFNQKSGVYNHIKKIHEGKKDPPGKCPQCDKYFANSSKVKRHIREVHERKRPFVCHLCDMTFGQSGNLKTHLRGKHRNVL